MNMFAPEGSKAIGDNCIACGLHEKCISPLMPHSGEGKLNCLIVAEAPGKNEDEDGTQLIGKAGRLLRKELSRIGLRLDEDFWKTNVLICRPPGNKTPTDKQVRLCQNFLLETIEELQPKFIWTLGNVATKTILGHGLKKVSISSLCNRIIPHREFNAWVMPLFHPSYLARNEHDKNLKEFFRRNLKKILTFMADPLPLPDYNPFEGIKPLRTVEEIRDMFDNIPELSTFDFEATGLYPWRPGHKLASMGVADKTTSYSFPIDHEDSGFTHEEIEEVKDLMWNYFGREDLIKVGHNVNFDENWAEWKIDAECLGKFPCTMVASHILDHRRGYWGLKDQAFLRWGIVNYDKAAEGYIKATKGTEFNRMLSMPLEEQLLYVGADARLTMKLHLEQQEEFTEGQQRANEFFIECLAALRDLQNNGTIIDVSYYEKLFIELEEKIKEIEDELNNSKDAERYLLRYKDPFNYKSPTVLKRILFEMNNVEPVKITGKGNASVDEEALSKLDYWMCPLITNVRKLEKLKGTYIKQYLRHQVDGVVYPNFQLHIPTSFRSSCSDPNVQNTPKRKPEARKMIRSGIIPPKGWKVFEVDGSGMEVSTSAMYHKDPVFMQYLTTPGTDMHRDNTCDLWMIDATEVTKMLRFFGKNMWTFAQFYGDYFGSCGVNLWKTCIEEENMQLANGVFLRDHMEELGITEMGKMYKGQPTSGSFLEHCKKVEDKMWNEKFSVYTQWKKDINDFYNEHGHTESLFGFIYDGYMDRKQTTNYLIQGCLQGHSKVLTQNGWERIDSLVGEEVEIWTGFEWKNAIGLNRGKCQIATVHLESGLQLDCDIRHEFKNESNEWVKFKDLEKGDYVALPKIYQEERLQGVPDIDWYFILGFCIGDGYFASREISEGVTRVGLQIFGGPSKYDILDSICDFLLPYHEKGFTKPIIRQTKENVRALNVEGKGLAAKLESFGYECNKTAHTKRIPKSVWTATETEQQSFMDGLWLADGDRSNKSLHMCNEKLLKEVQVLLAGLDYDSAIRKTKDGYKLTPRNVNHKTYSSRMFPRISFDLLRKGRTIKYNKRDNTTITDRRNIQSGKDISQTVAERILDKLNPDGEIYRYDKVTDIVIHKEEADTYTMSVDDNLHQFVADGIICKNTAFHLLMWVIIQVNKRLKVENWESYLIGEVHDSMIGYSHPDEEAELFPMIKQIWTKDLPARFDFINVPMGIEIELSETDGNFSELKEITI